MCSHVECACVEHVAANFLGKLCDGHCARVCVTMATSSEQLGNNVANDWKSLH